MEKRPTQITSDNAPKGIGPYSQAMAGAGLIFTSGQLPVNPETQIMPGDITEQTALALANLRNVLLAGGSDLQNVLKTTVYLADINDFPAVNAVYAEHFGQPCPARSCFAVKDLPLGAKIEIEAIALA
jgi:endoribonuclease L-PSP, putative